MGYQILEEILVDAPLVSECSIGAFYHRTPIYSDGGCKLRNKEATCPECGSNQVYAVIATVVCLTCKTEWTGPEFIAAVKTSGGRN